MKVACLQWTPVFKNAAASRARADELIVASGLTRDDVDVLLLPEMAFTGYTFASREDVAPYVEDAATGATTVWARRWATALHAYVAVGFPQVVRGPRTPEDDAYFNAMVVVDPAGAVATVYQKHFLFETDENWAAEGPGFRCIELPGLGKAWRALHQPGVVRTVHEAGLGICMDVNPYQFQAPFDRFEFGNFHAQSRPTLLLLSMAWLFSGSETDDGIEALHDYWLIRLSPLLYRRCTVAICNRTGTENGVIFAGGSCVLSMADLRVLGHLGVNDEGVLLVQVADPAIA